MIAATITSEYTIQVKPDDTFDSLVTDGNYYHQDKKVTPERFPVRKSVHLRRRLVLFQCESHAYPKEVIAEAAKQGLKRPTYEDCLRFGVQHPEVQRQFWMKFLHEPVMIDGEPNVLYLGIHEYGRSLGCRLITAPLNDLCRFVFVRPQSLDS